LPHLLSWPPGFAIYFATACQPLFNGSNIPVILNIGMYMRARDKKEEKALKKLA
jgi:hypothetical protein